jgi:hypothetical protein
MSNVIDEAPPRCAFASSDPHAWLYPICARLRADMNFGLLSPVHPLDALASECEVR